MQKNYFLMYHIYMYSEVYFIVHFTLIFTHRKAFFSLRKSVVTLVSCLLFLFYLLIAYYDYFSFLPLHLYYFPEKVMGNFLFMKTFFCKSGLQLSTSSENKSIIPNTVLSRHHYFNNSGLFLVGTRLNKFAT